MKKHDKHKHLGWLIDVAMKIHLSGQIIATSHEFSPEMGGNPLISGKSMLGQTYNLARIYGTDIFTDPMSTNG